MINVMIGSRIYFIVVKDIKDNVKYSVKNKERVQI